MSGIMEASLLTSRGCTRIYLAGPVRGKPDSNSEAFRRAFTYAAKCGWHPVSPLEIRFDDPEDIKEVMSKCLAELLRCDAIFMLNGWGQSLGAKAEFWTAKSVGMPVFFSHDRGSGKFAKPALPVLAGA